MRQGKCAEEFQQDVTLACTLALSGKYYYIVENVGVSTPGAIGTVLVPLFKNGCTIIQSSPEEIHQIKIWTKFG